MFEEGGGCKATKFAMATLFSLLAMLAWLQGDEHDSKPWLWASVLFFYLVVFSKAHAIMLPAVLLALTVLMHEDGLARLKQQRAAALAMFPFSMDRLASFSHPLPLWDDAAKLVQERHDMPGV